MSSNNEVAMTIIDPGNRRWAQLLDLGSKVQDLIPVIIKRIDLPEGINYQLIHIDSGRSLEATKTLLNYDISPGDMLQLSPVRDKLLTDLLDALYEEAVDYVAKELWGQAEARIETIRRLDPTYPDPQGVIPALAARSVVAGAASVGQTAQAAPASTSTSAPQPPVTGNASVGSVQSGAGQTAAASSGGCSGIAWLVLAVIVAAVVWTAVRNFDDIRGFLTDLPFVSTLLGDGSGDEPRLGTGDVQVTLRWDSAADIDLHVIDPADEEIWYSNPAAASGGQLDVDANGNCGDDPPVENIFWERGAAPFGAYVVRVNYYQDCGTSAPVDYEVTIRIDDRVVDVRSGTLQPGEMHELGQFSR